MTPLQIPILNPHLCMEQEEAAPQLVAPVLTSTMSHQVCSSVHVHHGCIVHRLHRVLLLHLQVCLHCLYWEWEEVRCVYRVHTKYVRSYVHVQQTVTVHVYMHIRSPAIYCAHVLCK